jgi:hypothetical protein
MLGGFILCWSSTPTAIVSTFFNPPVSVTGQALPFLTHFFKVSAELNLEKIVHNTASLGFRHLISN